MFNATIAILLFTLSFVICALIVLLNRHYAAVTCRHGDLSAVQAVHLAPTPRLGGIGVLAATALMLLLAVPDRHADQAQLFVLTLAPVFVAGFAEDLGWRVRPLGRLMAAAAASILVVILLQVWVPELGVPGLDTLFGFAPFAIVFSIVWATGICHAMNLIDGVNGLSGATAVLISTALGLVALQAGLPAFAAMAFLMIPGVLGFLVLNWPTGRIFLGDAGAYSLGHVLVWLSILIMTGEAAVTPTAVALIFFWPVADTMLAIYRRRRNKRPIGAPDRLHMHQFVMRGLLLLFPDKLTIRQANGLTAVALLPFVAMPMGAAVVLWDRPVAALVAWAGFGVCFATGYLAGMKFFRSGRWRRFSGAPRMPLQ